MLIVPSILPQRKDWILCSSEELGVYFLNAYVFSTIT